MNRRLEDILESTYIRTGTFEDHMKKKILYISLISKQDMSDIVDAVLMYGGDGIIVDKTSDGLEIRLDDEWLKTIILDEINRFI